MHAFLIHSPALSSFCPGSGVAGGEAGDGGTLREVQEGVRAAEDEAPAGAEPEQAHARDVTHERNSMDSVFRDKSQNISSERLGRKAFAQRIVKKVNLGESSFETCSVGVFLLQTLLKHCKEQQQINQGRFLYVKF